MRKIVCKYIKQLLPLLLLCFTTVTAMAQERMLQGSVKDILGYPIQGVSVTVKDLPFSAITNESGEFSVGANLNDGFLVFQYVGFENKEVAFDASAQTISVVLEATNNSEAYISIAYSKTKLRDLNGAVSVVNHSDLKKNLHPNMQYGLVGRLNGLSVFPSTYEPGNADYSAYIRGLKSTASNTPLVLVDNVERDFSQLSPNEIESITVLKDASALALYGSRGANGVVLVTTKRGSENKRSVTIDASYSLQQTEGLREYLNSYDYARLYNKAWQLDGNTTAFYSDDEIEGYRKTVTKSPDADPFLYPNNNYLEQFINKMSYQRRCDVSMTGGNESAKYFAMVGYLNQDGVFKYGNENADYSSNTNYQRINFRSNVDVNVTKVVSASLDMAGRFELRHYPGRNVWEIFGVMTSTPANAYPIFNRDGSLGGTTTYQNNPYGLIAQSGYTESNRQIFDATASVKFDFSQWVKGLSLTAKTGFDFNNIKQRGLSKNFKVYEYQPELDEYLEYGNNNKSEFGGAVTDGIFYRQAFNHEQLDYVRTFNEKHHITAMSFFDMSIRSLPGNNPRYKNVAFGARAQYDYAKKYYVEFLGSSTANEAYARGHRFGYFPAASLGWVVTEEGFLNNSNTINYLKLRASSGKTGSDRPMGTSANYRFLYLDSWQTGTGGYAFGNPQQYYSGSAQSGVGNPDLRWEEASKTNIGIDAELFQNHIYLSADAYYEKRTGIWVVQSGWVPSTYGASLPYENLGSTESKGIELILGTKGESKSFSYNVKAMANIMRSEILDLKESPRTWNYQYAKGKMMGEIWYLRSLGFFKDEDDIANSPSQTAFGTVRPGDIKYLDYNNDGKIDNDDFHASGKTSFPGVTFSLNADLKYKSFDFSMLWQGMADRHIFTPLYELPFENKNATTLAFDAWTPETAATAKYPRLTTTNYSNNNRASDFWMVNGSYIRLKSVELGYSLPKKLMNKAGFADCRLFVNGFNLITISENDFDPEIPFSGIYNYPAAKIYSMGLNLSF